MNWIDMGHVHDVYERQDSFLCPKSSHRMIIVLECKLFSLLFSFFLYPAASFLPSFVPSSTCSLLFPLRISFSVRPSAAVFVIHACQLFYREQRPTEEMSCSARIIPQSYSSHKEEKKMTEWERERKHQPFHLFYSFHCLSLRHDTDTFQAAVVVRWSEMRQFWEWKHLWHPFHILFDERNRFRINQAFALFLPKCT